MLGAALQGKQRGGSFTKESFAEESNEVAPSRRRVLLSAALQGSNEVALSQRRVLLSVALQGKQRGGSFTKSVLLSAALQGRQRGGSFTKESFAERSAARKVTRWLLHKGEFC